MSEVDLASLGVDPCRLRQLPMMSAACSTHGSHWVGPYCEFAMGVLEGARMGIELAKANISKILLDRSGLFDPENEHGKGLRYGSVVASAWQPDKMNSKGVAEHDILVDLIAEIRQWHYDVDGVCADNEKHRWPCEESQMADRAQARLNKLSGDGETAVTDYGYDVGHYDGYKRGSEAVGSVLNDLIEHLRAWERSQRAYPVDNPDYLAWMADRAEAQLKVVHSENA